MGVVYECVLHTIACTYISQVKAEPRDSWHALAMVLMVRIRSCGLVTLFDMETGNRLTQGGHDPKGMSTAPKAFFNRRAYLGFGPALETTQEKGIVGQIQRSERLSHQVA